MHRLTLSSMVLIAFFCLFIPPRPCAGAAADPFDPQDKPLSEIFIVGNDKTRPSVIDYFLQHTRGTLYDTLAIRLARGRLQDSGLFNKVTILHVVKDGTVQLYVVLTEKPYLHISRMGGKVHDMRYLRKPPSLFKSVSGFFGLTQNNFRGLNESVGLQVRLWEWRSLRLSWRKPLYPSSFFLYLSGSISDAPLEFRARRRFALSSQASLGKRLSEFSSAYISIDPSYSRLLYVGPSNPGMLTLKDSLYHDSLPLPLRGEQNNLSRWTYWERDSLQPDSIHIQRWEGDNRWEQDSSTHSIEELQVSVGSATDKTRPTYPETHGWYNWSEIGINFPYAPDNESRRYVELSTDVRYYHPIPIPLPNHTMAYRLQATLRSNDGGTYHRVVAGGESSVRGYSSGTFGLRCNANNKVVFNAEYRAQLLESPPIWVPPLATVYTKQATLRHRFDAALFFDGALLWNDILTNPLRRTHDYEREYGYSFGFGLRWMVPTMKRTFCFDFIPLTKSLDDGIENNDPHFNDGPLRFHWPFYYNFYLDFNF